MPIIAAAIRDRDGGIYSGRNHTQIERTIPPELRAGAEDGFLTDDGLFVDRQEAAKIAFECGQTKIDLGVLESTDLW